MWKYKDSALLKVNSDFHYNPWFIIQPRRFIPGWDVTQEFALHKGEAKQKKHCLEVLRAISPRYSSPFELKRQAPGQIFKHLCLGLSLCFVINFLWPLPRSSVPSSLRGLGNMLFRVSPFWHLEEVFMKSVKNLFLTLPPVFLSVSFLGGQYCFQGIP